MEWQKYLQHCTSFKLASRHGVARGVLKDVQLRRHGVIAGCVCVRRWACNNYSLFIRMKYSGHGAKNEPVQMVHRGTPPSVDVLVLIARAKQGHSQPRVCV